MYRMHHFPAFLPTGKLAGGAAYPWYTADALNSSTPLAPLGAFWELQGDLDVGGGNAFIYVKATEALAAGEVVSWKVAASSTVTASGSDTRKIVYAAGSLTVNAEVGNFLYIQNTTSNGGGSVLRRIRSNTATVITFGGADPNSPSGADDVDCLTLAATNGDVVSIIRPYQVQICTATTVPIGIALGTVTSGNYTIIQVAGLALAKVDGDTTDVTINLPCAPGAGGILFSNAAAAAGVEAYRGNSIFLPRVANTGAAALRPVEFNCFGNL